MSELVTAANLPRPDEFYERLIAAHRGLDEAQSAKLNAKLILLLANPLGDVAVIEQAIAAAREDIVVEEKR